MSATGFWACWAAMAGAVGGYGWVWQRAGDRGRKRLEWALVMFVVGVSAVSVALHEPWRDELHAWLQAREMGLGGLWREMAYEGHFLPWHLLLWPLAHFGAPVWSMGAMSWSLNAIAVWMLARKSPLTGLEKAAAGLSCLFLYVNPAIARSYVLVPLALFGVASLWGTRDKRPVAFGLWVALLANTHLYMEGMAGALFAVFAWENVLRRKDGKGWRECRWQWTGLGVMVTGGLLAAAQVLPGIWKSEVGAGRLCIGLWEDTKCFLEECNSPVGMWMAVAVLGWLAAEAWRKDRGIFGAYTACLAYMWFFSVFLYPAFVVNRALLWWPVALSSAWMLAGQERRNPWRLVLVCAAGLGLVRPDMTWRDWREDYDVLPLACRWVAEQYGPDEETWINGDDVCTEVAAAYLGNVMNWRTGERAGLISWSRPQPVVGAPSFPACATAVFRAHPEKESFLALAALWKWGGLAEEDLTRPGVEVETAWTRMVGPDGRPMALMRVWRRGAEWCPLALARYQAGNRVGAVAAWERAVSEDGGQWEAMNNLAWVALEDGRVEEARTWIDRAMEHEGARESAGARDTETKVRAAEDGARKLFGDSPSRSAGGSLLGEGAREVNE